MLDELTVTCETCGAGLGEGHRQIAMTSSLGDRRAYECDCGAVTITLVADAAARPE